MGRAPCCEKVGLKKGPWTKEEDHILISYIHEHGHENWRALPKKAGLLRCGKSCRLRWTNYLRPDIKRGNFSKEEEHTIIQLHQALGNRWSAIAAKLPGRTDNEIKNVWHTHLKKRLLMQPQQPVNQTKQETQENPKFDHQNSNSSPMNIIKQEHDMNNQSDDLLQYSSSSTTDDNSSSSLLDSIKMFLVSDDSVLSNNHQELMDQDIWNDVVSSQDHSLPPVLDLGFEYNQTTHDDIDFWCDLFARTEDISDLLEL